MTKCRSMAHGSPAYRVCRTAVTQTSPVMFTSNSSAPLHLIRPMCFTDLLHNETQWSETDGAWREGGVLWWFMAALGFHLSRQKWLLTARVKMNSFACRRTAFPSQTLPSFPKKKNYSALKICSVNHPTAQQSFISGCKHSARHTTVFHVLICIDLFSFSCRKSQCVTRERVHVTYKL